MALDAWGGCRLRGRRADALLLYPQSSASGVRTFLAPTDEAARPHMCACWGYQSWSCSTARRVAIAGGARHALTIEGPLAAAMGAGLPVDGTRGSMIVDIGGGKTEVAVLSLGEIVAGASVRIGGDAMDGAIRSFIREEHILSVGIREAERLKIELGSALGSALPLEEDEFAEVNGVDLLSESPKKIVINGIEIYKAIKGCVQIIVEAVGATLESTSAELVLRHRRGRHRSVRRRSTTQAIGRFAAL